MVTYHAKLKGKLDKLGLISDDEDVAPKNKVSPDRISLDTR